MGKGFFKTVGNTLFLLFISFNTFATSYYPDIKDCSLTKLGNHVWQARLNIKISRCSGCDDTNYNWVTLNVPKVNDKGKPAGTNYTDRVDDAKWSDLSLTGSIKGKINSNNIFINGSSSTNIIYGDASVSVNFSTDGNNAYPAVFVYVAHSPGTPGGFSAWIYPNASGTCNTSPTVDPSIPPIEEIDPVDPEFKMNSSVWNINTVDVGDLPTVTNTGDGYLASIKDIASNNFCISYISAGVKINSYALSINNSYSNMSGRNVFMMTSGDSQLLYTLKLVSNDGTTDNNFDFPSTGTRYIKLTTTNSDVSNRSQMCWTPQINLFKNSTTKAGYHSDVLNFVITPKA